MKVLINAISAKRGGIITYTQNLIDALRERNIDATVAVPPELSRTHPDSTMEIRAGDLGPVHRLMWEQVFWRRIVSHQKPDILFSSANFGLFASPVPQVLLLREGGLFDPFYLANMAASQGAYVAIQRYFRRSLMLSSARSADHVMTPSAATRDALLLWAPETAAKCSVNPYGTLRQFRTPTVDRRPWRADGQLRILYVSVYYPHKNPGVICDAVSLLRDHGLPTQATITMTLDEMTMRGAALDRILLRGAEDDGRIELGHRAYEELPSLYQSHDVFVFPSVSETFGHPMAEALSTGLPIIAADTLINREVCGDAALYFTPFMASDLCARIRQLNDDSGLRARLRNAALERAKNFYQWDGHVTRLLQTFEAVLARQSPV